MDTIWTTEQIKAWLRKSGKDRLWLAELLKVTKGTLDQYFSRGFPDWAARNVQLLAITKDPSTSGLDIKFSPAEWAVIQEAMSQAGYTDQQQFFRDAIVIYGEQILSGEQPTVSTKPFVITQFISPDNQALAAEDPTEYKGRKDTA